MIEVFYLMIFFICSFLILYKIFKIAVSYKADDYWPFNKKDKKLDKNVRHE